MAPLFQLILEIQTKLRITVSSYYTSLSQPKDLHFCKEKINIKMCCWHY
jgi:hypothetical protein